MEAEKRPADTAGKLAGATAAGKAGAQKVVSTPSPQTLLNLAADLIEEGGRQLHPVRLDCNLMLEIPPAESVELRGSFKKGEKFSEDVRVLPRSTEWLPDNVEVMSADVITLPGHQESQVCLTVRNKSRKSTAVVRSQDVLAELQFPSSDSSRAVEALIGPCCESPVKINGTSTVCLIDSGSQVTVVSEGFYNRHLKNVPLEHIDTTLNITGAGGQSVPYLGVVRVTVSLPKDVVGTASDLQTLAVVCPDTRISSRLPVIIGTNTLRALAKTCERQGGRYWHTSLPIRCEVAFAYREAASNVKGRLCPVRLLGRDVVVPPQTAVDVRGTVRQGVSTNRDAVLVQEPTLESLPDGLAVLSGKAPSKDLPRVKVTLVNHTDSPITVKGRRVVADLFSIQAEYAISNVIQDLNNPAAGEATTSPAESSPDLTTKQKAELTSRFRFGEEADPAWKTSFTQRLLGFGDVFSQAEFDIGRINIEHDIELEPGPPVRDRPRPIPPQDLEEVRQHIQSLLDANIIKPSTSPFASPIVLVRKKNGSLRMCVDYRKINARTIRDSYALPKIEELFMTLSGAKFFTSVDLSKAYYQVPLTERAKKISAFTTPFGLFEFQRLSFGLVNAPMTFQRLMERCFHDMNLAELIIFLDDVLVHAKTLDELEERTISVLRRLREFGLKLDPDKCIFCVKEVCHLGFLISADGIRPDPSKLEALTSWPIPKTVKDVKSFIGFAGYYRRWVPHFSQLVKPLNDLTAGYVPRKTQNKGGKRGTLTLSSDISHLWREDHQTAFEGVIRLLTSAPILGIADRGQPFTLHCDASGTGLGAVLYQRQDGVTKVIAYASRGLNKTEANYPAHKREFLALKWAMTEKFHDYLIGSKVTVVTDNNPLCHVLKNAKLDATSHRWLAALSLYDFDIRYKRGATHVDADGLSRRPQPPPEEDPEYRKTVEKMEFLLKRAGQLDPSVTQDVVTIDHDTVSAVMTAKGISTPATCLKMAVTKTSRAQRKTLIGPESPNKIDEFVPAVEAVTKTPEAIPDDVLTSEAPSQTTISKQEWRKLQRADHNIAAVIDCLKHGNTLKQPTNAEQRVYAREMRRLVLQDGVLYRKTSDTEGTQRLQLVIPHSSRKQAMKGVHEDLYHTHFEDSVRHARMRFFWPFMASDLERKIKRCERCVRRGAQAQKAPMATISTTHPLELLSIDFLTIDVKGQKQNILVVMDHFTKYAQAILTKDQTARTVARALWDEFFMIYGFPSRILSDQGRDFESKLIKELCTVLGIEKCRTTPYHPAGNPVERWNRTLINMLRSLEDNQKKDWRKHLRACVHAYNACIHQSTGYSPYYLFFGRQPKLPVDLAFGIGADQKSTPREYIGRLKQSLKSAYQSAAVNMAKTAERNKARYDLKAHAATLEAGDRVLVRRLGPKVTSKVDDRWEEGVYKVVSKAEGLPVYTVQREDGTGPQRTLHRNLLLPIGALGFAEPANRQVAREQGRRKMVSTMEPAREEEDEEEVDHPTLVVKVGPGPTTQLRAEAPEFVPAPAATCHDPGEVADDSDQEEEEVADSEQEGSPSPLNQGHSGSSSDAEGREDEEPVREAPVLRRSRRTRRPVDRYFCT